MERRGRAVGGELGTGDASYVVEAPGVVGESRRGVRSEVCDGIEGDWWIEGLGIEGGRGGEIHQKHGERKQTTRASHAAGRAAGCLDRLARSRMKTLEQAARARMMGTKAGMMCQRPPRRAGKGTRRAGVTNPIGK